MIANTLTNIFISFIWYTTAVARHQFIRQRLHVSKQAVLLHLHSVSFQTEISFLLEGHLFRRVKDTL